MNFSHSLIKSTTYHFLSAVHSLTRCPAKGLLRSYYCPRSYDSPDQTRCCSWYGAPSCCLPGGLSCSEQQGGHVRDYCPGPYDDKDNRVCCIINNKAKCCQVHLRYSRRFLILMLTKSIRIVKLSLQYNSLFCVICK